MFIRSDGRFITDIGLVPVGASPVWSGHGKGAPVLRQACDWLDRYFSGERPSTAELPLRPLGTVFQHVVWNIVSSIPYGHVASYGRIARRYAAESGRTTFPCQAVGGALKRNPLLIVIPCHRVIGSNGRLIGYAGGLAMKKALLLHEGYALPSNTGVQGNGGRGELA